MLKSIIKLARIDHWVKNVVVLMPVVFAQKMNDKTAWVLALAATAAFCLASSFAYAVNDIVDAEADKRHPKKKDRPLACGALSKTAALIAAVCFLAGSLSISFAISGLLTFIIASYLALQIAYSEFLKKRPLIDVICIALGFVLRAAAGAVAIKVVLSPWLFICMFSICLFMGFCKRYNEMVTLENDDNPQDHRHTLILYTPDLLTHLITLSAGIAVVVFLFYGLSDEVKSHIGTNFLIYTLPLVVYAVFRFAMLSMKGVYADPTDIILHDRPFQITIVLWALMTLAIIFYGEKIYNWLPTLYQ